MGLIAHDSIITHSFYTDRFRVTRTDNMGDALTHIKNNNNNSLPNTSQHFKSLFALHIKVVVIKKRKKYISFKQKFELTARWLQKTENMIIFIRFVDLIFLKQLDDVELNWCQPLRGFFFILFKNNNRVITSIVRLCFQCTAWRLSTNLVPPPSSKVRLSSHGQQINLEM